MTDKKKTEIKSWKNLEAAFAGESMAYQKYLWFAKIAEKNGDSDIAELFRETAKHETRHAEGHLRNLYPMGDFSTEDLLRMAAEGERYEYTEMYPSFAQTARDEGAADWIVEEFEQGIQETKEHSEMFQKRLEKLQKIFAGLAKVEEEHFKNYQAAYENKKEANKSFSVSDSYLENAEND